MRVKVKASEKHHRVVRWKSVYSIYKAKIKSELLVLVIIGRAPPLSTFGFLPKEGGPSSCDCEEELVFYLPEEGGNKEPASASSF
jgi:hypothetical protein